ncbi:MAG TPA: sigma-54 dependent transcriptional regulator, partial [Bdellovibrionales bacterium]|nr:sigma-54 dependent transcriptional regulator [Bdellovibrionales bacterium]
MKIKGVHVLIVDDEAHQRMIVAEFLSGLGAEVRAAANGHEALQALKDDEKIELVISDLQMPELDGLGLLKAAKSLREDLPFIVVTAHGTIETAIEAIRQGAAEYLLKPLELEEVRLRIQKILEVRSLARKAAWLETEHSRLAKTSSFVFESPVMKKLFADLNRVVGSDTTVLLSGETGAGKEVVARFLHDHGPRAKGPFMAINCSAVPDNLLESQFFGHEKGAFTGADRRMLGSFELANGGTLFLDEIGEMDLKLQAKMLRALEERKITRLGSPVQTPIDVRIIAATNKSLPELVKEKRFREDLYYRLNVVHFQLPPLRERKEDLPALVRAFIERELGEKRKSEIKIEPSFLEALSRYAFPGNVRELRNIVERALLFAVKGTLTEGSLPSEVTGGAHAALVAASPVPTAPPGDKALPDLLNDYEKALVAAAVERCKGDVEEAAKLLKISRSALYSKLSKYG